MATIPQHRHTEIERDARRRRVTAILLSGVANQTVIAAELGVNQGTISRDIRAIEAEWRQQSIADLAEARGQDLQRLDRLLAGIWDQARKGHLGAIDRVVKVLERRAKILGYDAPERMAILGELTATVELVTIDPEDI